MDNISHGLRYRLVWSILAAVIVSKYVRDYLSIGSLSALVNASAFLLLGLLWFMQPTVFGWGLRETIHRSAQYAIRWKHYRTIFVGTWALMCIGQVLMFAGI
jgi:hypothetical protein